MRCPHGDPTCPCPDGDGCHYEGPDAMPCPNPPRDNGDGRVWLLDKDGNRVGDPLPFWIMEVRLGDKVISGFGATGPHCHVEGCTWAGGLAGTGSGPDGCGLARLEPPVKAGQSYELGCGAIRTLVNEAAYVFAEVIDRLDPDTPEVP